MFGEKKVTKLFWGTVMYMLLGALVGVLAGLVFGLFIGFVTETVAADNSEEFMSVASFLGMGIGTLLGAIFGGRVGYNK